MDDAVSWKKVPGFDGEVVLYAEPGWGGLRFGFWRVYFSARHERAFSRDYVDIPGKVSYFADIHALEANRATTEMLMSIVDTARAERLRANSHPNVINLALRRAKAATPTLVPPAPDTSPEVQAERRKHMQRENNRRVKNDYNLYRKPNDKT